MTPSQQQLKKASSARYFVGQRVQYVRESVGMTQVTLAARMGFKDRQTISDIENSRRSLKVEELMALSDIFDKDVEFFMDVLTTVGESQFAWKGSFASREVQEGLISRAQEWMGLLRFLRESAVTPQDPLRRTLRLGAQSTTDMAADCGEAFASLLTLGRLSTVALSAAIEQHLQIPVLWVPLPETICTGAGRMANLDVLYVNSRADVAALTVNLARSLFQLLTWDVLPPAPVSPADAFLGKGAHKPELMAHHFVCALLKPAALQELQEPVSSQAQDPQLSVRSFSQAMVVPLHRALDRGHISARRAARTLGLDLYELRLLFTEHGLASPFEL